MNQIEYTVVVKGALPPNLVQNVSSAHASAVKYNQALKPLRK